MSASNMWAERMRDALFMILGRRCAWCGARKELSCDVIHETAADLGLCHHREYSWSQRMAFYRAQLLRGNLQVLCLRCNTVKANRQLHLSLPVDSKKTVRTCVRVHPL